MKTVVFLSIALLGLSITSCQKDNDYAEQAAAKVTPVKKAPGSINGTNDTEDRPKAIKGHIKNASSDNIADASVTLHLSADSSLLGSTSSDAYGVFQLDSFYSGNYYIKVVADGYQTKYTQALPPWGESLEFDVGDIIVDEE